jgi:hypothetical protein
MREMKAFPDGELPSESPPSERMNLVRQSELVPGPDISLELGNHTDIEAL